MKPIVDCTFCNGKALLKAEIKKRNYRGEEFKVCEHFYECNKCSHKFTNAEVDTYNINLVHNKYREYYNIPSPDQLLYIREWYGLSQTKMSEILGFGSNQYRLYETGDIPSGGNATVLSLIIEPNEFRNIITRRRDLLLPKTYNDILTKISKLQNENLTVSLKQMLFPKNIIPNGKTGYRLPSFKKISNMTLYFLSNAPFKTRLNKLLSFSDFAHFKYFGYSISGCKYAAINMGSVLDEYAIIFGLMESEGYLATESVNIKGNEVDKFIPLDSFNATLFSDSELEIFQLVLDKFKSKSTEEVMNISHEELGWKANIDTKSIIDYSIYAPQLKAV